MRGEGRGHSHLFLKLQILDSLPNGMVIHLARMKPTFIFVSPRTHSVFLAGLEQLH